MKKCSKCGEVPLEDHEGFGMCEDCQADFDALDAEEQLEEKLK